MDAETTQRAATDPLAPSPASSDPDDGWGDEWTMPVDTLLVLPTDLALLDPVTELNRRPRRVDR